jgi:Ca2+-binding RTX toxin-like protein
MAVLTGTSGSDVIYGTVGNDLIQGLAGIDLLIGDWGDDTLVGGAGTDILAGKAGIDTVVLSGNLADYTIGWDLIALTIVDGVADRDGTDYAYDVEYLQFADVTVAASNYQPPPIEGTAGDDTLIGSSTSEIIRGGDGADSIQGMGGPCDSIEGGTGNDTIEAGSGNDSLYGGSGDDSIIAGAGDDSIHSQAGEDYVDGGDGIDVYYADDGSGVILDLAAGSAIYGAGQDTLVGIENVEGTAGNDSLGGNDEANYFKGYAGSDTLIGGAGDDTLLGGVGSDVLDGGAGNDVLHGNDFFLGDEAIDVLIGGAGDDTLNADYGHARAVFTGNLADYTVTYNPLWHFFYITDNVPGRDGRDLLVLIESFQFADGTRTALQMGAGELFVGSWWNDTLTGTDRSDWLLGYDGDDLLWGQGGADELKGGGGADTLNGGAGNDTLDGGGGIQDSLDGGDGIDTAVFGGDADDYAVSYAYELDVFTVHEISAPSWTGLTKLTSVEFFQFNDGTRDASEFITGVVNGTDSDDDLEGTTGADVILGREGNDTLSGLADADVLYGGAGNDLLQAGEGDDRLRGDAGNDTLEGDAGNDAFWGDAGDDFIDGGDGADVLRFYQATAAVSVDLKSGWAHGAFGNDALSGIELVEAGAYDDTLAGSIGADRLEGRDGNDLLSGDEGNDTLFGGYGDDTVAGGGGTNELYGESGIDTVSYVDSTVGMVIELWARQATGSTQTDYLSGFENVRGSNFADVIYGDAQENVLNGGAGNDTLEGGGYNDRAVYSGNFAAYTITYDADVGIYTIVDSVGDRDGIDRVSGVEYFQFADGVRTASQLVPYDGTVGDDSMTGTALADVMRGFAGNDTLRGAAGDDSLDGGSGNDLLDGGDGIDTASYAGTLGSVNVSLSLAKAQLTGAGTDILFNVENLIGSDYADVLFGNALANRIEAGSGNDTLNAGMGADTMVGGAGNDTYTVDNPGDVVTELSSEGADTVLSMVTYTLGANIENLALSGKLLINGTGNAMDNVLTGNAVANVLTGDDGNDTLDGGAGVDTLIGGAGNDTYIVDNVLETVTESADSGEDIVMLKATKGIFTLSANIERLQLTGTASIGGVGNALDNRMLGNSGANNLNGAAGNDLLDGGLGLDVLTGGAGHDVFRFTTSISSKTADKITDFNAADDTILLSNLVFTGLATGTLSASAFQAGASSVAASASVHVIFNTVTGALLYDVDGNGAVAAVQFATITLAGLVGSVTASNFDVEFPWV